MKMMHSTRFHTVETIRPKKSTLMNRHNGTELLFILFVCFSAVDRIDFFQQQGDFSLTIELILSLIVSAYGIVSILQHGGKAKIYKNCAYYFRMSGLLMSVIYLSSLLSEDPLLSFKRMVLLTTYVFASFVFINIIAIKNYDLKSILIKGMKAACVLFYIASVLDIAMWFNSGLSSIINSLLPSYNTDLSRISYYIFRCKGLSGDANRCGIFLVVCTAFLFEFDRGKGRNIFITLNVLLVLLTNSRTAGLALLIWAFLTAFMRIKLKLNPAKILASAVIIIGFICLVKFVPLLNLAYTVLLERFVQGTQKGSGQIHLELILYGISYAVSNIKVFLIGNGYGTSSLILTSFFSSKYANFHNQFVTYLVENGIISVVLFSILLISPAIRKKRFIPLVSALIIANLFYQTCKEQWFWITLACMQYFSFAEIGQRYAKDMAFKKSPMSHSRPEASNLYTS